MLIYMIISIIVFLGSQRDCSEVQCGEVSMEVVVGVKAREEDNIEDGAADKLSSGLASLKEAADPVVYKLVRVNVLQKSD